MTSRSYFGSLGHADYQSIRISFIVSGRIHTLCAYKSCWPDSLIEMIVRTDGDYARSTVYLSMQYVDLARR